jgi:hypothetical protein
MKSIGFALMGLLFLGQSATALPTWSAIAFTTTPQNAPQVAAAADKFMNSPVGKEFPGLLLLQVSLANGSNPSTHSFVPLFKSAADREAYTQKLLGDPAWAEFQATMAQLAQPVSQVMYRTLKSWGEVADTDLVWMSYAFAVEDPAAFLAALGSFMASETGKKFPGQVHIEGVIAGGITQVTHAISVGYASEAEMETWADSMIGNADWAAYLAASRPNAQLLGATMGRTIKSWGSLTLGDVSVP